MDRLIEHIRTMIMTKFDKSLQKYHYDKMFYWNRRFPLIDVPETIKSGMYIAISLIFKYQTKEGNEDYNILLLTDWLKRFKKDEPPTIMDENIHNGAWLLYSYLMLLDEYYASNKTKNELAWVLAKITKI